MELRKTEGESLPIGFTHWILATQTCSLLNSSFSKVGKVEWIGATEITIPVDTLRNGDNVRDLHTLATSVDCFQNLWLSVRIENRYWSCRLYLANLTPPDLALRDIAGSQDRSHNQKQAFAAWLGRSYTRTELSNTLNTAISNCALDSVLHDFAKSNHARVYGIFFQVEPDPAPITPVPPHEVSVPCRLSIRIVVENKEDIDPVLRNLVSLLTREYRIPPPQGSPPGTPKVLMTKIKAANAERISISADDITAKCIKTWTVDQQRTHLRYSFEDKFSSTDEGGLG